MGMTRSIESMGYRNLYTAVNMAGEEYNISDKGLSITPAQIRVQAAPGEIAEGVCYRGASGDDADRL